MALSECLYSTSLRERWSGIFLLHTVCKKIAFEMQLQNCTVVIQWSKRDSKLFWQKFFKCSEPELRHSSKFERSLTYSRWFIYLSLCYIMGKRASLCRALQVPKKE
jgi:hypothetical protein